MTSSLVDWSHAGEAYSSVGLTSAVYVYAVSLTSFVHSLRLRLKNPREFQIDALAAVAST